MRYDPHHGHLVHPPEVEHPRLDHLASRAHLAEDEPVDWTDFIYIAVTFGTASGILWLAGF